MGFTLATPATPEEAIACLRDASPGSAVPLAGGTDLLLDLDSGRARPTTVVSLRRLPWRTLRWNGRTLTVGSTLPLAALEQDARVRRELQGLADAVHAVGSVALRHRATLGGNLGRASPASDLLPILLALDARVGLVGPSGRRELPVTEFVQGSRQTGLRAGELIESVVVPEALPCEYVWQRVRPAHDISQVGVAVALGPSPNPWRIAVGGVLPCPRRVPEAEGLLTSASPSEVGLELAAQEAARRATFVTDQRATEAYRRRLVTTLVRRAVRSVAARAAPRRARGRR